MIGCTNGRAARGLGALIAATLVSAAGLTDAAADEIVAGVVVRTEAREIFVNLGQARGVTDGAQLRIKRPITLRHPVTRRPVVDWLPIGAATVTAAGGSLTMAVLEPALRARVEVGDVVEVYVERDDRAPPPAPAPADPRPLPQVDAQTAELLTLWRSLNGATLERRITAWEGWLAAHASSPHAAAVAADLEALRAWREAGSPRRPTGTSTVALDHDAPRRATSGRDLPLTFVIAQPAALASASLHYRARGATTYRRVLLAREGDLYLRGAIPAELVRAPGVEYFVETVRQGGDGGAAFASPERPQAVEVDAPPLVAVFDPAPGRVRLSLHTSLLDFATFDRRKVDGQEVDRRDRFALAELDVLYRLRGALTGVRVGFGSYRGVGGVTDGVWTDEAPPPAVGYQYGYVEGEVATGRAPVPLGAALRLIFGVADEGFEVGATVRGRIGSLDGTNLSASFTEVATLGFASDLRLETWPDARLPVGISVGVTDQPGHGDLGVRLATDVGWQARPWVRPTLRVSWQGRTTEHSGIGGGLGVVFDW